MKRLIVFCARCASCALDVSMRNICARFSPNAQYMRKICARLYLFPQCARFAQDCTYFSNAQHMRKIVLISSMHNICTRLCTRLYLFPQCAIYVQDCTHFSNAQYMPKICARLYLFAQCAIYVQDLCKIVLNF